MSAALGSAKGMVITMETLAAIRSRKSTRAFLQEPVPRDVIVSVLDAARWCGSFMNCQPWKLTVLGGKAMQEWKDAIWDQHCKGEQEEPEFNMGGPMREPYGERCNAFREAIDGLMFPPGIDNIDERRAAYTRSGIIVRDAPNAIVVHIDKGMAESPLNLLAVGGIVQAIALGAQAEGLGSCVMVRPVMSHSLLRRVADISEDDLIVCCIALGYSDTGSLINTLERTRAPLEELVTWRGF